MTKAEFLAWLDEVERTVPVARWRAHDVAVWPIVRLQLLALNGDASVVQDAVGGGRLNNLAAVGKIFGTWLHATVRDWSANATRLRPADAVFLTYSYGTQPTIGGRRYNPLLAPYVDLLQRAGRRSAVWEMCHQGDYNIPRSIPSAYIQPQLVARRIASLFTYRPDPSAAQLEDFDRFLASVSHAGLVNRYGSAAALLRDAYFVRQTAAWFKARLAAIGPAQGFVADYGLREQAFCLACRELGIPAVEIQHGVINAVHPAYAGWRSVPDGGYETRPSVFWCWDAQGVAAIEEWAGRPGTGVRALLGGDPWREQWLRESSNLVRAFDAQIAKRKAALGAATHVLVTLDPTGPVVPEVLLDAMSGAPRDWCFWVRLHPLNLRERMSAARRAIDARGIRCAPLDVASEWPLHAVLRHMDAHVTGYWSTVVMEAEDFGVASIACAERAREIFPGQIASGTLQVASTAADVLARLPEQVRRKSPPRVNRTVDPERAMRELVATTPRAGSGALHYPAAS
jgi:hypothetical protein